MPTYEYVCAKCGHRFEKFQAITEKPLRTCPKELCGQRRWGRGKVRRVIGAGAGLLFKGSGFYITDYRSESYKQAAKKETPATPASSGQSQPAAAAPPANPGSAAAERPAKTSAR